MSNILKKVVPTVFSAFSKVPSKGAGKHFTKGLSPLEVTANRKYPVKRNDVFEKNDASGVFDGSGNLQVSGPVTPVFAGPRKKKGDAPDFLMLGDKSFGVKDFSPNGVGHLMGDSNALVVRKETNKSIVPVRNNTGRINPDL